VKAKSAKVNSLLPEKVKAKSVKVNSLLLEKAKAKVNTARKPQEAAKRVANNKVANNKAVNKVDNKEVKEDPAKFWFNNKEPESSKPSTLVLEMIVVTLYYSSHIYAKIRSI
jgi:hypothetical protein